MNGTEVPNAAKSERRKSGSKPLAFCDCLLIEKLADKLIKDILDFAEIARRSDQKIHLSHIYGTFQELGGNSTHYFDRGMHGTAWSLMRSDQFYAIPIVMALASLGAVDEDEFFADFMASLADLDELRHGHFPSGEAWRVPKSTAYWWARHYAVDVLAERCSDPRKSGKKPIATSDDRVGLHIFDTKKSTS